jgi:hypothetical protein
MALVAAALLGRFLPKLRAARKGGLFLLLPSVPLHRVRATIISRRDNQSVISSPRSASRSAQESPIWDLTFRLLSSREGLVMDTKQALLIARKTIIDGATLAELKAAVSDLRALTPNSALADLVEAKINALEHRIMGPSINLCCE